MAIGQLNKETNEDFCVISKRPFRDFDVNKNSILVKFCTVKPFNDNEHIFVYQKLKPNSYSYFCKFQNLIPSTFSHEKILRRSLPLSEISLKCSLDNFIHVMSYFLRNG